MNVYKPCKYPECTELLIRGKGSYCTLHRSVSKDFNLKYREESNNDEILLKLETDKKLVKFYNSIQWKRLRLLHLHRYPLCVHCHQSGQVIDHIIRIKAGGKTLDPSNLQTMCHQCHNIKRSKESRE